MYYVLNEANNTVPASSLEWGQWLEGSSERRRVGFSTIANYEISTVFLGLDHQFNPDGPPLLFETMVFGGTDGEEICQRYSTWQEAEAGHRAIAALVRLKANM